MAGFRSAGKMLILSIEMNTIGVAMIVSGTAILFGGLVSRFRTGGSFFSSTKPLEESEERFAHYLRRAQQERSQPANTPVAAGCDDTTASGRARPP